MTPVVKSTGVLIGGILASVGITWTLDSLGYSSTGVAILVGLVSGSVVAVINRRHWSE